MIRFFTAPNSPDEKRIMLSDEDKQHIRSLRIRPNEEFIVCDGAGTDYVCRLCADTGEGVAQILRKEEASGEPTVSCTLYIAYAKGSRLDYAVQKAVELGAKGIVLFKSKRCTAVSENTTKKLQRLNKISHEAAKQCGRGMVPKVKDGGEYTDIIEAARAESALPILLFEDENKLHLKEVLENHFKAIAGDGIPDITETARKTQSVAIVSGPEGGFEVGEAEAAKSKGIHVVSLGPRVLRSETAPIAALSALMYHTNNL